MRANSFIFTLYGDFVQRDPAGEGRLAIGTLVRLMDCFGFSEQAVRQAVSRLSRQGWLAPERRRGRAHYRVTEHGARRIEVLNPRIYGSVTEWDGRWRMLAYGIGEARRAQRDRLRKDLAVLGWAPLRPSMWISPSDRLDDAREAARAAGLLAEIDTFVAENRGPRADRELLERCWDLPAIARAYEAFAQSHGDDAVLDARAAFAARMRLVHDYRKFAYIDPGLPGTLLPARWPGTRAAAIFRARYASLQANSQRFYEDARSRAT